jgi:hypothetical protein
VCGASVWAHRALKRQKTAVSGPGSSEAERAANGRWNGIFKWYQLLLRTNTPVTFGAAVKAEGAAAPAPPAKKARVDTHEWEPDF